MTTPIDQLLLRPFSRAEGITAGLTPRVLEGPRFVRMHPRVYRHRDLVPTRDQHVAAAALALPPDARTTGLTRLHQAGLDHGPAWPMRFVIEGELHLALRGVFLHRTVRMPPTDRVGVTPAAAFVAYCATATVLDAIVVGDWLLGHGHGTVEEVRAFALDQPWRRGTDEALWVLPLLDARSRSVRESQVRAWLELAGLPRPDVNVPVDLGTVTVVVDMLFPRWRTIVEYEGAQHQLDRRQYVADIDRYRMMRRAGHAYVQITREKATSPRAAVREVHDLLVEQGYDGPPPDFGRRWELLRQRLCAVVASREERVRRAAAR